MNVKHGIWVPRIECVKTLLTVVEVKSQVIENVVNMTF